MKVVFLLIVLLVFTSYPLQVFAAKPRVRKQSAGAKKIQPSGVKHSSVKLSRSTNSIIVTFINLGRVEKITYELSYVTRGVSQGVVGTLIPSSESDTRDLYFGTCSKGVCTPHTGITNAVLVVRTSLKTGELHNKRYRIKW